LFGVVEIEERGVEEDGHVGGPVEVGCVCGEESGEEHE